MGMDNNFDYDLGRELEENYQGIGDHKAIRYALQAVNRETVERRFRGLHDRITEMHTADPEMVSPEICRIQGFLAGIEYIKV